MSSCAEISIHHVFVLSFLQCVQTTEEVIFGLFTLIDDPNTVTGGSVPIDAFKVKVSIEYKLCKDAQLQSDLTPVDS